MYASLFYLCGCGPKKLSLLCSGGFGKSGPLRRGAAFVKRAEVSVCLFLRDKARCGTKTLKKIPLNLLCRWEVRSIQYNQHHNSKCTVYSSLTPLAYLMVDYLYALPVDEVIFPCCNFSSFNAGVAAIVVGDTSVVLGHVGRPHNRWCSESLPTPHRRKNYVVQAQVLESDASTYKNAMSTASGSWFGRRSPGNCLGRTKRALGRYCLRC